MVKISLSFDKTAFSYLIGGCVGGHNGRRDAETNYIFKL